MCSLEHHADLRMDLYELYRYTYKCDKSDQPHRFASYWMSCAQPIRHKLERNAAYRTCCTKKHASASAANGDMKSRKANTKMLPALLATTHKCRSGLPEAWQEKD